MMRKIQTVQLIQYLQADFSLHLERQRKKEERRDFIPGVFEEHKEIESLHVVERNSENNRTKRKRRGLSKYTSRSAEFLN